MGKKGARREASRLAIKLAEGVFSTSVDMILWSVVYLGEMSLPQSAHGQVWRAQVAADRFLNQVNYDVIKHALTSARKRGWVKKTTRRRVPPEITEEGLRRLTSLLPVYDEYRAWDSRMHLVTYDIPEKRKMDRELLREYLRRIGCGMLQDSVWMTPYNPINTLRRFIDEHRLSGTIIISDLGKDGSIGEEGLTGLVVGVYRLEQLNDRYQEWIDDVQAQKIDQLSVVKYLSVLRDDPQLPFVLLPSWWVGDEAYHLVRPFFRKLSIFRRQQ